MDDSRIPESPAVSPPAALPEDLPPTPKKNGILILLILVAILLLISVGGFVYWRYFTPITNGVIENINLVPTHTPEALNQQIEAPVNTTPDTPPLPDQDHDGLNVEEEARSGTSDTDVDSDDDLLNDKEELTIYGTDPLDADTDGDSFTDGGEVKNLYNPNGPGKLFNLDDF